jgi:hypothetical protein
MGAPFYASNSPVGFARLNVCMSDLSLGLDFASSSETARFNGFLSPTQNQGAKRTAAPFISFRKA